MGSKKGQQILCTLPLPSPICQREAQLLCLRPSNPPRSTRPTLNHENDYENYHENHHENHQENHHENRRENHNENYHENYPENHHENYPENHHDYRVDESDHDKETWYSGENEDSSGDEDKDEGGERVNLIVVIPLVIFYISTYICIYL